MRAGQAVRPPGPQPGRSSNCSSFISPVGQVRIVLRRALWFNSKKQPWRRISHLPSFAQTGSEIKDTSLVVSFLKRKGEPSRGMGFGQLVIQGQSLRTGG